MQLVTSLTIAFTDRTKNEHFNLPLNNAAPEYLAALVGLAVASDCHPLRVMMLKEVRSRTGWGLRDAIAFCDHVNIDPVQAKTACSYGEHLRSVRGY